MSEHTVTVSHQAGLDLAPTGSIVVVGHPNNGVTARKDAIGVWRYTHGRHEEVAYDDLHKASTLIYAPGTTGV